MYKGVETTSSLSFGRPGRWPMAASETSRHFFSDDSEESTTRDLDDLSSSPPKSSAKAAPFGPCTTTTGAVSTQRISFIDPGLGRLDAAASIETTHTHLLAHTRVCPTPCVWRLFLSNPSAPSKRKTASMQQRTPPLPLPSPPPPQRQRWRLLLLPLVLLVLIDAAAAFAPSGPAAAAAASSSYQHRGRSLRAGLLDGLLGAAPASKSATAASTKQRVQLGDLKVSPMGVGTWSWCVVKWFDG
jgi:hypothetical protein